MVQIRIANVRFNAFKDAIKIEISVNTNGCKTETVESDSDSAKAAQRLHSVVTEGSATSIHMWQTTEDRKIHHTLKP